VHTPRRLLHWACCKQPHQRVGPWLFLCLPNKCVQPLPLFVITLKVRDGFSQTTASCSHQLPHRWMPEHTHQYHWEVICVPPQECFDYTSRPRNIARDNQPYRSSYVWRSVGTSGTALIGWGFWDRLLRFIFLQDKIDLPFIKSVSTSHDLKVFPPSRVTKIQKRRPVPISFSTTRT